MWQLESLKDFLFWNVIIGIGSARVPGADTWIARRVAGPGLANDFFFQISPEAAVTLVKVYLEGRMLTLYENAAKRALDAPEREVKHFEGEILKYAGVGLSPEIHRNVTANVSKLRRMLSEACERRRRLLPTEPNRYSSRSMPVRLTREGVQRLMSLARSVVLRELPAMIDMYERGLEDFDPETPTSPEAREAIEAAFWNSLDLPKGDVDALTRDTIRKASVHNMLEPLEDTDSTFALDVDHVTTSSFIKDLIQGQGTPDDLERVTFTMPVVDPVLQGPAIEASDLLWTAPCSWRGKSSTDLKNRATPFGGSLALNDDEWKCFFAEPSGDKLLVDLMRDAEAAKQEQEHV